MRTTVIPAQITSVEDKITGNLSFTQVLLLVAALFIATFIYLVLPTSMHVTTYKIPLMLLGVAICLILALRVKGTIVLQWLMIVSRYVFRARYFVYNKNDVSMRDLQIEIKTKTRKAVVIKKVTAKEHVTMRFKDVITVENTLLNPKRNVRFAFKKKGVYVSVS